MRDFKVGDVVKVKDWGKNYTTYEDWFISHKNGLQPEWIVRYAYGNDQFDKYPTLNSDDDEYRILYLSNGLALITRESELIQPVYLVGISGLKFPSAYTLSMSDAIRKLEDLFGCPVEIVGGVSNEHNQSV